MQDIDHDDNGEPCAVVEAEGNAISYEITTVDPQELTTYFRYEKMEDIRNYLHIQSNDITPIISSIRFPFSVNAMSGEVACQSFGSYPLALVPAQISLTISASTTRELEMAEDKFMRVKFSKARALVSVESLWKKYIVL